MVVEAELSPLDVPRILECFHRHEVEYLVVGGVGAQFHGALRPTKDFDSLLEPSIQNLDRVAAALRELNAYLRVEGLTDEEARSLPVQVDGEALKRMDISTWLTDAGALDVITGLPTEAGDRAFYNELQARSETIEVQTPETLTVQVAALSDIIASKVWSDRPKDHQALPELRRLEADQARPSPGPRSHPSGGIAPQRPGPGLPPGLPPTRGQGFSR